MKTINDYLKLIPSQYAKQPKFVAELTALIQPLVDVQNLDVVGPFDLDTAVGVQLDVIGQWVGVSRDVATPLVGVYFSLDDANLGLDQGIMQGPNDPSSGLVQLPDDQYRQLILARIANNQWDGTIEDAYHFLDPIFEPSGATLIIQDNRDMSMIIALVGGSPTPVLLAMFTGGYLNVKPAGVQITFDVSTSGPLFGLDVETTLIAGLDVGAFGSETAGP